jgi:GDP-mannose 6-dehydrogenase
MSTVGIGLVGAVFRRCLPQLGHHVIGVNTTAEQVAMLRAGHSPILADDGSTASSPTPSLLSR